MNFAIFLVGLFIVLWIAQVTIACIEKRMIWPYSPLSPTPPFEPPTGYGINSLNAALAAGFSFLGWTSDMKGEKYRISYAMLVSPERDSIIIIGVGKIMGMTLEGTWIHTPATDGTSFYSVDHQNCAEIDVSRSWKCQLVPHSRFETLWRKHREHLATWRKTPRGLRPQHEMEDFRAVREEHYRLLARQGFIDFTDRSETHWRYTFLGAMKWATFNYTIGLLRGMTSGRLPRIA